MNILIVGASQGLGRAFAEGLASDDDLIIGISRNKPEALQMQSKAVVKWIEADMFTLVLQKISAQNRCAASIAASKALYSFFLNLT